jgi:citrate lyase subunit beta / citryl-CoA lyase
MPFRTFLFAPGNHARRVEKAFNVGADAVILDLEDAVAIDEKRTSRHQVVAALQRERRCAGYVRVNAMETDYCFGDLMEVVQPGIDGIVLPKVETAAGLFAIDWLIAQLERDRGMAAGKLDLIPIIETAKGIDNIREIARCGSRVRRMAFGAGDFTLDANMPWSDHEDELAYARSALVTASRAAQLESPIDSVWVRLDNEAGLERSAARVLGVGFQGKMCIHPKQIPIVNAVFTPSDDEVRNAERIVDAFSKAEESGSAAFQLDGKFIDYPIVYRAKRLLETIAAIREATPVV